MPRSRESDFGLEVETMPGRDDFLDWQRRTLVENYIKPSAKAHYFTSGSSSELG